MLAERDMYNDSTQDEEIVPSKDFKVVESVTLGELMGNDFGLHISAQKNGGFRIEIENDDLIAVDDFVNPYAAEAFALFCKQYVKSYENALKMKDRLNY